MSPASVARARAVPNEPMLKMRRTGFHSVPGDEPSSNGRSSMCATLYGAWTSVMGPSCWLCGAAAFGSFARV